MVPEASSQEELEVDQEEILPACGRPRLGVHRSDPRPQRQDLADPADESGRGPGPSVAEDTERSQPVRSGVGTVSGRTDGLEAGPHSCGTGPDRLFMEESRRQVSGVPAGAAGGRTAVAPPPSGMALFRWTDDVRQPGVVTRQLPPAASRTPETLMGPSRVL